MPRKALTELTRRIEIQEKNIGHLAYLWRMRCIERDLQITGSDKHKELSVVCETLYLALDTLGVGSERTLESEDTASGEGAKTERPLRDEARADAQAFLERPQNFYVAVYDRHERRVVDVLRQPDVTETEVKS